MPATRRKEILARWRSFKARNRGNPALKQETLYAIPPGLLSAIAREAPDLIDSKERRFERDLSRFGGVGFYCGRPISYPLLSEHQLTALDDKDRQRQERVEQTGEAIEQLHGDLMTSLGRSALQIEDFRRRSEQSRLRILERQRGYVGWLLTEQAFQTDRDSYCTKWRQELKGQMAESGIAVSLSWLSASGTAEIDRAFHADTVKFLWKWGLEALATSELPIPIQPGLHLPNFDSPHDLRAAGTVLFVPWYLVIDKDLRLEEIIEHRRMDLPLSHLAPWLRGRATRQWGFARYAVMLRLYFLIELVFARRYPERLEGQYVRLDRAVARFALGKEESVDSNRLDRRADGIRRIRVKMEQRLRPKPDSAKNSGSHPDSMHRPRGR